MDPFVARHRFDRWFWIGFVLLAWLSVAMGFSEQISRRFSGQADYPAPAALEIHVWSFFAWLTMLSVQVGLVESGRTNWHRMAGIAALVIAPVMAWSAIAAEVYSQRFYAAQYLEEGVRFFPVPVTSITLFSLSVIAALALRKHPSWHRRCIYLATSAVLVAAFFRWWDDAIYGALPPGFFAEWAANYAGVVMLLAIGAAYDLATRGQVHSAFRIGIPLFVLAQLCAIAVGQSDWWLPVGIELLGLC